MIQARQFIRSRRSAIHSGTSRVVVPPSCRSPRWLAACLLVVALAWAPLRVTAQDIETPTSSGPASQRVVSQFRIPRTPEPPKIDGEMSAGEWENSSALSGFWYAISGQYYFLAPHETQLQVYACYDKQNLYLAFTSPVYPRDSWLRSRGRFPDVIEHPLYGIYRDDYCGIGLRPYHDNVKSHRMGGFYFWINPISVIGDVGPKVGRDWQSEAVTKESLNNERWIQEVAIPLKSLRFGPYEEQDADGNELVDLPPPDGTEWIFSFRRCAGEWAGRVRTPSGRLGYPGFKNEFSDTASKLIFDSKAVSVQVNELGPIMEDIIDVQVTLKNHDTRSHTVRLGFFVESAEGNVYSSYTDPQLKDGQLELRPGQRVQLRLRKPLPGITTTGNTVWFDVRTAGHPAKPIFQTKLIPFHSQEKPLFKEIHINDIGKHRPPRKDFDYRFDYSYHNNQVAAVVDTAISGASKEAQTAVEARLLIEDTTGSGEEILSTKADFNGPFACIIAELPELKEGRTYRATVILFDQNKRIVGEDSEEFTKETKDWMFTDVGLDDAVWEPFTPLEPSEDDDTLRFKTLKHEFTLADSGLPAQIRIKPDPRELPLEWRDNPEAVPEQNLVPLGRGPQLRHGYRLEAVIDGNRIPLEVVEPAKLSRQWDSELEYQSKLKAGELTVELTTQYDCDGAMHVTLSYGAENPVEIERLEMVADFAGPMDMTPGQGETGVVWDSADSDPELYYSHFVPWKRFGSNERGFSWICRNEKGWLLDRDGSAMTLERNANGEVSWRILFVNHTSEIATPNELDFTILTHPAKPRPKDWRRYAWLKRGKTWAHQYMMRVPLEQEFIEKRNKQRLAENRDAVPYNDWSDLLKDQAWFATGSKRGTPYEQCVAEPGDEGGPWVRYGLCRNVSVHHMIDRHYEERAAYWLSRHVSVGRRRGFWWDETWPMFTQANWSDNLATGDAYLRDPESVESGELPWHRGFLTFYMRRMQKRLARVFKESKVPLRNYFWANDAASAFESFAWDIQLVEMAGSHHTSVEIDSVVAYPADEFRFFCQKWTGTIARVVPGYGGNSTRPYSGDDTRFDRQYLGRALTHDIGVCLYGPHGSMNQPEQGVRLLNALRDFQFFDDEENLQFLPYWRTGEAVRYGPDLGDREFTVMTEPPTYRTYVSAYRRPFTRDQQSGYQVLFIVMNEGDKPVHVPLHLLDSAPFFGAGAKNQLRLSEAVDTLEPADEEQAEAFQRWNAAAEHDPVVLLDVESGHYVSRQPGNDETYGPLHVPSHEYRILWGYALSPDNPK
ncbi:MAG: hypothetical protein ACOCWJ_02810 [Verrucomicrobiota bacterium]